MKKIGVHTFGFAWHCDAASAIQQLQSIGVETFQLMAIAPHLDPFDTSTETMREIAKALQAANGQLVALDLASNDINLASTNAAVVDFAVNAYLSILRMSAALGGKNVTVNTGRRHLLLPAPDGMLEAIYDKALARIAQEADKLGLGVIVENIPGAVFPSASSLAELIDRCGYDNVKVLYDVANAVAIGENPVDGLSILGKRTTVVHLSDTPNGGWKHAPIGTGDVDFAAVTQKLMADNYQGDIVLEILSPDPLGDVRAGLQKLGDIILGLEGR